jgi:hypothetical protein
MSSLPDPVVVPFETFVEHRERRRRTAAVLHVCDRWELDVKAAAVAERVESVVPSSTPGEWTEDGRGDS